MKKAENPEAAAWHNYHTAAIWALSAVFLVILAGAVVRTTGSGMGCPDWPKCFGQWVPPTTEAQLPPDYQTKYNVHGHGVAQFNALQTWTEYINRLIGAIAGLFVAFMVLRAFQLRSFSRWPLVISILVLLMMGFQAWLGKKVVDTNLKENMITIHMVVAVLIVYVLLWALRRRLVGAMGSLPLSTKLPSSLVLVQLFILLASLVQLVLGTQVREQIDAISAKMNYMGRETWIAQLDVLFYVHRSFSLLLLALGGWVAWKLWQAETLILRRFVIIKMALLLFMIVSGIVLAYWAVPAWMQPLHLLVSIGLLALEFVILLNLNLLLRRRMPLWGAKIVAS